MLFRSVNGNITLVPTPKISGLTLNPTVVYGGSQSTQGTVTLQSQAGGGGVVVNLSDNTSAITTPATPRSTFASTTSRVRALAERWTSYSTTTRSR